MIAADFYALASGEAVVLDDMAAGKFCEHIFDTVERSETLEEWVAGDGVLREQIAGESFAGFDLREFFGWSYDWNAYCPQGIGNAGGERRFRADDRHRGRMRGGKSE